MSIITSDISRPGLAERLAASFHAVGSFLIVLAEAHPRAAQLERLSRLSDEQLKARGTSRYAEIQRICGPRFRL
jgi:hypothetical protein